MSLITTCGTETQPPTLAADFSGQIQELGFLVSHSSILDSCKESLKLGLVECQTTYDLTPGAAAAQLRQLGWQQEGEGMVFARAPYKLILREPAHGVYLRSFYIRRSPVNQLPQLGGRAATPNPLAQPPTRYGRRCKAGRRQR